MGSLDTLIVSPLHMDLQQYQRKRSCSSPPSRLIQYICGRIAHTYLALVLCWNLAAGCHSDRDHLRPKEFREATT